MLPAEFAQDTERLARFEREAKTLASLNHPNIAQIYGFEKSTGVHALVMELVEGPTLADRITQGPIPVDEALPIAKQIAEALEAAHEQGIIHRDLKPANVKVRPDGTVKVLDFGLAKAMDPAGSSPSVSQSPTLSMAATQAGIILGTASYMSPEQARGKSVDKRADIWSFGVVLFEMLTGTRAFAGEDVTDTLAAVVRSEPPWDALPDAMSPTLRVFLRGCLHKDPKQRVGDIRDVRLALEGAFETTAKMATADPAVSRPTSWRQVLPWSVSAVTAAALILAVGWGMLRSPSSAPGTVTRWTMNAPDDLEILQELAVSPDGTRLVFSVGSTAESSLLYGRSMTQIAAVPIRGTDRGRRPFFSPDGASIGFVSDDQLKRVSVEGGPAVVLADNRDPLGGSWGADGTIIYSPGFTSGLWRVSAAGGDAAELTTPDVAAGELGHWWPQILPGDQAVLYTAYTTSVATPRIVVRSLRGDDERTLVEGGMFGRYLSSGHLLYAQGEVLFAAPFDLEQLRLTGPATPVLEDVALNPSSALSQFAVSENGSLAYFPASTVSPDRTLAWIDRGGAVESLSDRVGRYYVDSLSPDGTRATVTTRDPDRDVWVLNVDRGSMRPLTVGDGDDFAGQWTPDGEQVIYASEQRVFQLFRIRADGNGEPGTPVHQRAGQPADFGGAGWLCGGV